MTLASVTVVGSVNLDIVASVARLPSPGETVTGAELHRFPGGKGANQALAARRLGADVSLVARVGEDAAADEALALLREGGVDLDACHALPGVPTGTALIAVDPAGENQIVVAPGANRCLRPGDLPTITTQAIICQLEVPVDTIEQIGVPLRLIGGHDLAHALPHDLLDHDGHLLVNVGAGVATLQRDGELVAEATPPSVATVDATGAGDTFTSALTVALVEGRAPDEALNFACRAGAMATTRMGAQPSLPQRAEIDIEE